MEAAKSEEGRKPAIDRYLKAVDKNMEAMLGLVRDHPEDPGTIEALDYVVRNAKAGPGDCSERAIRLVRERYTRSAGAGAFCEPLFYFFQFPEVAELCRDILRDNPTIEDRGLACHALASHRAYQARLIRKYRGDEAFLAPYEGHRAQARIRRFFELDPTTLEAEAAEYLKRTIAEFPNVRLQFGTSEDPNPRTLSEIAAGELFALQHLGIGQSAPEIEGSDLDSNPFKLSESRGKVVLLTFSGNWCGPCRGMYPQERDLVERLKNKPFVMLSVNTDEDKEVVRKSVADGEITWRCWLDGGTDGPITTRWGVSGFPEIYLIDHEGVIRHKGLRGEELDRAIEALVDKVP